MFSTPYRTQATNSKSEREQLDNLLKVSAPHEQVFLAIIGVIFPVFLCWLVFGSITRTLSIDGILVESGARYPISAKSDGRLETWLVAPGERLEPGDPVARQTVPELENQAEMLRALVASVSADVSSAADGAGLASLQASARKSLLQLEAERIASGVIVSQRSGVVMTLLHSPGEELRAGDNIAWIRAESELPFRVIAQVPDDVARHLSAGMTVTVTVAPAHEAARQFRAQVADATAKTWPDWLTSGVPVDPGGPLQRVDFLFDPDAVAGIPDGTPVKVDITLEQHAPAALLVRTR